ncbi:MAG TPA: efflux RND transporter periplasmic adaptor subunit [Gammaproteobacteria bacterium]|nr:efflux RND transporter periplasmic adaptor subunit [Gammaproteobacteria bacterium]
MKLYRRLVLIGIAALIVAAIAYAYLPRPVDVSVTTVSRGDMAVSVEEEGRTRVRERYIVTAPVAAYAPRITWHVGDGVQAGQVLTQLEPLPPGVLDVRSRAAAQARVDQARAALRSAQTNADAARASADYAARELKRITSLKSSGVVSQAMLDQAEAEARRTSAMQGSAKSAIEVARYDLTAAETALRYTVNARSAGGERVDVTSPVNGVILAVQHEDEGVVTSGQPLLTVGDPHSLEVAVDVLSPDAVRIRAGTRVLFTRWGGDRTLEGRVRTVEPVAFTKISALGVEEQRVWIIVDFVSPEKEWIRLGDAYRLDARFLIWESKDALRVPSSALFRNGDSWQVMTVHDGRLLLQDVRIGERGDLYAQVLGGLSAGDKVVTYPDDTLRAGERADIIGTRSE